MRIAFRILTWPIRLLWRATMPRRFPHGRPFDMRAPVIIDGDTVFHDGRRIRIWGIDAPEMSQPDGQAAKERLIRLCHRRHIHVVPRDTDIYGRTVAQLYCGRGDIGAAMVASGFAASASRAYAKIESKACRRKAGLWQSGPIPDPAAHRRAHSGGMA